jgi:hypothetical protein
VRTARRQTPANVSGCRSGRRAAGPLAARPSRACIGPAPRWKRCQPAADRARSYTSPTSCVPGRLGPLAYIHAHRAGSTTGPPKWPSASARTQRSIRHPPLPAGYPAARPPSAVGRRCGARPVRASDTRPYARHPPSSRCSYRPEPVLSRRRWRSPASRHSRTASPSAERPPRRPAAAPARPPATVAGGAQVRRSVSASAAPRDGWCCGRRRFGP